VNGIDVPEAGPEPLHFPMDLTPALAPDAIGRELPPRIVAAEEVPAAPRTPRILIADDEPGIRLACRCMLELEGIECDEVGDGRNALEVAASKAYDVVVLDVDMPNMRGMDVCRLLRATYPSPHLKIILISGRAAHDEMARMLLAGADDYLGKPFSGVQFQARVKAALRLKESQDRSNRLNRDLERGLVARDTDLIRARDSLVLALAKLAGSRDNETGEHLLRIERSCVYLAERVADTPTFAGQIDRSFIEILGCCAPLHDIGKVGLPDHILLKPGLLEPEERRVMETHTVIGFNTLRAVAVQHGFARTFLQMGMDIARHHHERFDGLGYPDRLAGGAIPLAARIVTICDVYDALRTRRVYKPAMPHDTALRIMTESSEGMFDPALLHEFLHHAPQFDRIHVESISNA
jgi:response regulator RpfG family c-di-GMP phosphodiesterase